MFFYMISVEIISTNEFFRQFTPNIVALLNTLTDVEKCGMLNQVQIEGCHFYKENQGW